MRLSLPYILFVHFPDISTFDFFFQAEDGIRDGHVTGVQTCALPIFGEVNGPSRHARHGTPVANTSLRAPPERRRIGTRVPQVRSEERRVGKERTSRSATAP